MPAKEKKAQKVHIYKDSDGEFRVYPPVVVLGGDANASLTDDLTLVNHTEEDLLWYVPPGPFDAANPHSEPVKKGGKSASAKNALKVDVATTYAVFMIQSGKKAKGNSDPVIIVE
jgi:hypothetical protein